jgi:hypothetical protein
LAVENISIHIHKIKKTLSKFYSNHLVAILFSDYAAGCFIILPLAHTLFSGLLSEFVAYSVESVLMTWLGGFYHKECPFQLNPVPVLLFAF